MSLQTLAFSFNVVLAILVSYISIWILGFTCQFLQRSLLEFWIFLLNLWIHFEELSFRWCLTSQSMNLKCSYYIYVWVLCSFEVIVNGIVFLNLILWLLIVYRNTIDFVKWCSDLWFCWTCLLVLIILVRVVPWDSLYAGPWKLWIKTVVLLIF